jgi:hypothetical protein
VRQGIKMTILGIHTGSVFVRTLYLIRNQVVRDSVSHRAHHGRLM